MSYNTPSRKTPSRKDIDPAHGSAVARASVRDAAGSASLEKVQAGVKFEAVLRRVVELAEAVLFEQRRGLSSGPASRSTRASARGRASSGLTAQQTLTRALEKLDPEVALKLRTVMVAGRDGRRITHVHVNMTMADADSAFRAAARDSSENGPLLADYLRRGHALACATGLDVEKPFGEWASAAPEGADEGDWLRFGRQLATTSPEDWNCLAFVAPRQGSEHVTQLYLKQGELEWWSFRTIVDRPSADAVDEEKRAVSSRQPEAVATGSLTAIASRPCGTEGRALHRAIRAIRARVGYVEL